MRQNSIRFTFLECMLRSARHQILVLHGPNLNLLGIREPHLYGNTPLAAINARLQEEAQRQQGHCTFFQSNSESQLIDRIHQAIDEGIHFILINPAAFTHTSLALRDALLAVAIPFIEIHLSNIYARETIRQRSYLADCALGMITGLGVQGYSFALTYALTHLSSKK